MHKRNALGRLGPAPRVRRYCFAIAVGLVVVAPQVCAERIAISSWAGRYADSQRMAYFQPFERETGVSVLEDHWGGHLDKIRAMVAIGNYLVHVFDGESTDLERACDENILELIDYAKLGLGPEDFLPGAVHRCGVGSVAQSMVMIHGDPIDQPLNETTGATGLSGWSDFWDLSRFPGRRGLRRGPEGNLEIALLADGVSPHDVYSVLQTSRGVDRAFAKLNEIRQHLVWWEAGRQPMRLIEDGDVVMSSAWHGRAVVNNAGQNVRSHIVWHGQLVHFNFWMIPKGHPHAELALRFIAFASRPERQAAQALTIPYGPLRRGAEKYLEPNSLATIPTTQENLKVWLKYDGRFWIKNKDALTARFEEWLGKSAIP